MSFFEKSNILILDDDKYFRYEIKEQLNNYYNILECENINQLKKIISQFPISLAVIDLSLDNKGSLQGFRAIEICKSSQIKPIVLSHHDDTKVIKSSYEKGALQYFTKEKFVLDCKINIDQFFQKSFSQKDINIFFPSAYEKIQRSQTQLQDSFTKKRRNIFIFGENGTGKNEIAQFLLQCDLCESINLNPDSDFENMSKLPTNIYIQDIESFSLGNQEKMIHYLKKHILRHKVIITSMMDLDELLKKGLLLPNFVYLLNVYKHKQPNLKSIPRDFLLYVEKFQKNYSKRQVFSVEALEVLKKYLWPGNLDELQFYLAELSQMAIGLIEVDDISDKFFDYQLKKDELKKHVEKQSDQLLYFARSSGLKNFTELIEEEILRRVFQKNDQKVNKTIKELKISKSHFYRILRSINDQEDVQDEIS
jgi:DNA-binding NtrC family response regulator